MNQPDLGLRVTELRLAKNLTQEQLAEYCEVSTRTIQRIESGEVEPRSFTRNSLSNILEFDLGEDNIRNENLWLALLHLSSAGCIVFVPLLLWSWKKDQSVKIDTQGRHVLNFQITMTILIVGTLALLLAASGLVLYAELSGADTGPIGYLLFLFDELGRDTGILGNLIMMTPFVPLVLVLLFTTSQAVANTVRALTGRPIRYVLSLPLVT